MSAGIRTKTPMGIRVDGLVVVTRCEKHSLKRFHRNGRKRKCPACSRRRAPKQLAPMKSKVPQSWAEDYAARLRAAEESAR